MKELSIEEKAVAYDKVREKIALRFGSNVAEEIFSVFEKSEDEKIRKELIHYLQDAALYKAPMYKGAVYSAEEAVAWLEKQAEQKLNPILDIDIPFGAKDSELQEASYYIPEGFHAEIEGNRVVIKRGEQKPADTKEYDFHGIKFIPKFKEGDVIRDKKRGETTTIRDFSYDTGLYTHTYGQFPITIQDDYEKIKPIAWSEEDERMFDYALAMIEWYGGKNEDKSRLVSDWLQSLKARVQPKQEWSEEDESMLTRCIGILGKCYIGELPTKVEEELNWLKSLKDRVQPQSQWKPSTDQLAALFCAIPYIHCSSTRACACSLYNDLRKLMKI